MIFSKKSKIRKLQSKGNSPELFHLLSSESNPAIIQAAAQALGHMDDERTIGLLTRALNHKLDPMREAAARALMYSNHSKTVELLLQAIGDSNQPVRELAATGLARAGNNPQVLKTLLDMVRKHTSQPYQEALDALARIGAQMDPATRAAHLVQPLGLVLEHIRQPRRDAGVETLEWMGWESDINAVRPSLAEVKAHNRTVRAAIVTALEQMQWQPDQSAIAAEYWIVHKDWDQCVAIGKAAIDPLIAAFKHEEEPTRHQAYLALVKMGDSAAPRLIEALNDDYAEMRQAAFQALVKVGPAALPEIVVGLQDSYEDVRIAAAHTLGEFGHPDGIEALIEALGDPSNGVRTTAYRALLKMGEPTITPLLAALRYSTSQEVRWHAVQALEKLGWQPAQDEVSAVYWMMKGNWIACARTGLAAVRPLVETLEHWDSDIRNGAIKTLLALGPAAIKPYQKLMIEQPPALRLQTVLLLETLAHDEKIEARAREMLEAMLAIETDVEITQAILEKIGDITSRQERHLAAIRKLSQFQQRSA